MSFGGGRVAVAGALCGLGIAVGVPAVLLALGQSLGQVVLTILVVLAIAGGGLICLVSAFFGLVMPRHLRGQQPWMDPDKWRRFSREQRRWHRERWGGHPWAWGRYRGQGDWEDFDDGDGEDAPKDGQDAGARPPRAGARRAGGPRR